MVRDPDLGLADSPVQAPQGVSAPPMFRQPADPPPPLARVGDLDPIRAVRREHAARLHTARGPAGFRTRARAWAGRVTGRADRRLLQALTEAIDALAVHSDGMVDRINSQLDKDSEVIAALGEEISWLRAEVIALREIVNPAGHRQA
jgi:hypothetical protein